MRIDEAPLPMYYGDYSPPQAESESHSNHADQDPQAQSLVVLIGPSGSGKSTFARKHFLPDGDPLVGRLPGAWSATTRTTRPSPRTPSRCSASSPGSGWPSGRLTVIDATNVQPEARKPLVELARQYHCLPVAIVLDLPERVCQERNRQRPDRDFGPHVVRNQQSQLRRSLRGLRKEGFRHVFVLETPEEVEAATVERVPLWNDKRDEHGPFDIIGDVHGCCDELEALLRAARLRGRPGWRATIRSGATGPTPTPRAARRSSSATWWTVARASSTRCGWCGTWSAPARPSASPATTT